MDIDDSDTLSITNVERMDTDDSLEEELSEDIKHDNTTELYETFSQVGIYIQEEYDLLSDWYSREFKKILRYANIRWDTIGEEYGRNDSAFGCMAYKCRSLIIALIEEYGSNDKFSLIMYYELLGTMIQTLEHYYKYYYNPHKEDMDDLMGLMDSFGF